MKDRVFFECEVCFDCDNLMRKGFNFHNFRVIDFSAYLCLYTTNPYKQKHELNDITFSFSKC